jgi:hypothetical protein
MRGVNYQSLMANWMAIIDKLCEEKTPHDVLGVVVEHLENTKIMVEKMSLRSDNLVYALKDIKQGINHIKRGMRHIDPES